MKTITLLLLIIVLICTNSFSQTANQSIEQPETNALLGLSSGINNQNGLIGINGEVKLIKNIAIMGGIGLGGWGSKASIGIKYYRNFPYQTHFGIYYSSASGIDEFITALDTEQGDQKEVTLELNKAKNLNLIIGYNWEIFNRSRIYLEGGYSIPLQEKAYEVKSNHDLTEASEAFMQIYTPGGLIMALGISFGL